MAQRPNCNGLTRRDCLKLGLSGLVGGGLAGELRVTAGRSRWVRRRQAKACILIWMDGGPSHYKTFDPKPDAPVEIRGKFATIETRLTGVRYSQYLPRLAANLDKYAVIRSIRHDQGNHGRGIIT